MQAFQLENLLTEHQVAGRLYHEFLRVPTLSMGLYILKAGSNDPQQPHEEDEVYYVLEGQAKFTCEGQEVAVRGPVQFCLWLPTPLTNSTTLWKIYTCLSFLRHLSRPRPLKGNLSNPKIKIDLSIIFGPKTDVL